MIRATNSIAVRFDSIAKILKTLVLTQLGKNQEKYNAILQNINKTLTQHTDMINSQGKQIGSLSQLQKKDNTKLLKLTSLHLELATCGMMDNK